jgi:hypothetical protein
MLSLPSFPMKHIKVFALFECQNKSVEATIEKCNGSKNIYVNEYICSLKRNLHVDVK